VNPILLGVALVVVAGAVMAVSVRDSRIAVVATGLVLAFSSVLSDPLSEPVAVAARAVGAILASYFLWIAARERPSIGLGWATTDGSRIGWPAEVFLAAAAAVAGLAAHGLGAPALGTGLASAAGFAVAALAVLPALTGRDVLRVGLGLLLLVCAALLVRAGLGGTGDPLEQLLTAGLLVTLAAAVAAMSWAVRTDGGGLGLAEEAAPGRSRRAPDAHPMDPADAPRAGGGSAELH
jgi:hypothetical protein